ncbi:MAG: metallophosphoesterase family protein [Promethearchaeota archaeon]
MRLLFITDLHGVKWKYKKTFELAKEHKVNIVINGGDMLPGKVSLSRQNRFIQNFLEDYFHEFNEKEIYYLSYLGNDDAAMYDEDFQNLCDKFQYIHNLAQKSIKINTFEFIGMNWVPDFPFPIKDRARKDNLSFILPNQRGTPIISKDGKIEELEDWGSYIEKLPTIEEELNKLIKPTDFKKAIYVIHTPPANIGLDICYDSRRVGSNAVYEFILKNQPIITLHGHIHECANIWGKWNEKIGDTICIQPGQTYNLVYVIIDLNNLEFERFEVKKS